MKNDFVLIRLFRSKPNNLFILIHQYLALFDLLGQIMLNYGFVSICFTIHFMIQITSFLFVSIWFRIQTLKIGFGHESSHKKHYLPKLTGHISANRVFKKLAQSVLKNFSFVKQIVHRGRLAQLEEHLLSNLAIRGQISLRAIFKEIDEISFGPVEEKSPQP